MALPGGLDFNDHRLIWTMLDQVHAKQPTWCCCTEVRRRAPNRSPPNNRKVPQIAFKPDWTKHAKAVPFKRNDAMVETLPIGVLHFPFTGIPDNLADKAKKLGIPVWKFRAMLIAREIIRGLISPDCPFLDVDVPLFIDPVLLEKSSNAVMASSAVERFRRHFEVLVRMLTISNTENDAAWKGARRQLDLSEPPENGLGYGGSGRSGSSRPQDIRKAILRSSKEIVTLGGN